MSTPPPPSNPSGQVQLPLGFRAHVGNIGIKDDSDDVMIAVSESPCVSSAVFTRSRFAGPSVTLSRANAANHDLQAVVVVSKNANVATGEQGLSNAKELAALAASAVESAGVGLRGERILVASTGVIGRQYPMDRVRGYFANVLAFDQTDALALATAMMTTDTHAKVAHAQVGEARIVGIAKGVGMIEPDMATMLTFVLTDARVAPRDLDDAFRRVVNRTFNSLSVDTDTSTSDTAAVLANGLAGPVDPMEFEDALFDVCLNLTRQLAADGEGATKLLSVTISGARDDSQAKRVAKSVLNSPLVKTAVHGADPNWGRVAMAIGKCHDDTDIDPDRVTIGFGGVEVYPTDSGDDGLRRLEEYLAGDEVEIQVDLGIADGSWTVYGCDLSDGYVRINADYTT
ncbi:MAG: bifunctional glutamate N-acetyltransferase/amino-acid acetyltransferase ArgJ [Microthrixaceae bacterium]